MSIRAVVQGVGHFVPENILTNADLEKMVETSDEWIVQRTGIKERRICSEDQAASDLAYAAGLQALEASGTDPKDLDMIVVGCVLGDYLFPSTACLIQNKLGATNAGSFDVGAACAGFIYSTATAAAMIETGAIKTALVVGVDTLSKFTDYTDRSTCVLFGDGAGAIVLKGEENTDRGVIKTVMLSDGSGAEHIILETGGSRHPAHVASSREKNAHIYMNGNETYRFAVKAMGDALCKVLDDAGMTASEIDLFVPHQANIRIIQSSAQRIGLPEDKVFINIEKYGNTSAGSIPIGLYEAEQQGRLKKGDVVLTVGFGAGLVWGANLIRW